MQRPVHLSFGGVKPVLDGDFGQVEHHWTGTNNYNVEFSHICVLYSVVKSSLIVGMHLVQSHETCQFAKLFSIVNCIRVYEGKVVLVSNH